MTSMPASRRARAMTLAPRSWPSRPGFAMTTLSFLIGARQPLNNRHFLVLAPHFAERVAHFADRRVGPHRIEDPRHQVLGGPGGDAQAVERAGDRLLTPTLPQRLELGQLRIRRRLVDVEN